MKENLIARIFSKLLLYNLDYFRCDNVKPKADCLHEVANSLSSTCP